jgi:hypothetical protein
VLGFVTVLVLLSTVEIGMGISLKLSLLIIFSMQRQLFSKLYVFRRHASFIESLQLDTNGAKGY